MTRRRETPAQYAKDTVRIAVVLDEALHSLAFEDRMVTLARRSVDACLAIVQGEHHQLYATRGERWSDTYNLRRAQDTLARHEAARDALAALVEEEEA